MNKTTLQTERIWEYLLDNLTLSEKQRFEKDLTGNKLLKSEYINQKKIYDSLSKTEIIEFRKQLSEVVSDGRGGYTFGFSNKRWLPLAASLIILLAVSFILLYIFSHDSEKHFAKESKSFKAHDHTSGLDLLSDSKYDAMNSYDSVNNRSQNSFRKSDDVSNEAKLVYELNPMLESMVQNNYRSNNMKVISPGNDAVYKPDDLITFSWQSTDLYRVTMMVMNNRASCLIDTTLQSQQSVFTCSLPPGLYYWKLTCKDEIIFIGKFMVNDSIPVAKEIY